MPIRTVGVVGAGVMGIGVAHNLAQTEHKVILADLSQEILDHAREEIAKNLRLQRLFSKASTLESIETILDRIIFTTDYNLFINVDFMIENVTEKWEIKEEIHARIDQICPENVVFAANTSCISITRIGSVTNRPDRMIGTHFMNPVHLKSCVEVIRGYHTSAQTVEATRTLLHQLGKEAIVVNDYPGFVSNRISHLFMNEAVFVVQDQVSTPQEVDEIFKKCYGHTMGPLETADLIGLDTVMHSLDVLYESFQDPKFRCCPLLRKMVDAGLHGCKSGQGFYTYK